jgi:hypothetical protein
VVGDQIAAEAATLLRTASIGEAELLLNKAAKNNDRRTKLDACRTSLEQVWEQIVAESATLLRTQNIQEAELFLSCATKRQARYVALHKLQVSRNTIGPMLIKYRALLKVTESIDTAVIQAEQLHDRITRLGKLRDAAGRYEDTIREFMLQDMRISRLVGVDEAGEILDGVREKIRRRDRLADRSNIYRSNQVFLDAHVVAIRQWAEDEQRLVDNYKDTLIAAGVCPVCGSQITKDVLKEAI